MDQSISQHITRAQEYREVVKRDQKFWKAPTCALIRYLRQDLNHTRQKISDAMKKHGCSISPQAIEQDYE